MDEKLNVMQIYEEPDPKLVKMIRQLRYKAEWSFKYVPPLTLVIYVLCDDSTGENNLPQRVTHKFRLPPKAIPLTASDMREWLIRQIINVETHEACENFKLPGKDDKYYQPFFPHTDDIPDMNQYKIIDKTEEES